MELAKQFPFAKRVQLRIGYFAHAQEPMYDYVFDVSRFLDLYSDTELCHHKGTHDDTVCSLLRASAMPFLLREFQSFMQETSKEDPLVIIVSTPSGGLQRQESVAWVLSKLCEAYCCTPTRLHRATRHMSSKTCLSTCEHCREDTVYKDRVGSCILEYVDR